MRTSTLLLVELVLAVMGIFNASNLLGIAVLAVIVSSALAFSREDIISDAIQEVRISELLDEVQMQEDGGSDNPSQLLRAFKRASKESIEIGKARVRFEKMLRRAERKIVEAQEANNEDELARAESIATLMMQPPGTVLSGPEVALIAQEAGCREPVRPDCSLQANEVYRTLSGICNNLKNPEFGAARTPFRRLIPSQYEDGFNQLRGTMQSRDSYSYFFSGGPYKPPNPSPRIVSTTVVEDKKISDVEHSYILMQWGQFLDHDIDLAPAFTEECKNCELNEQCVPIRIPENDETFGEAGQTNLCMEFGRSIPICSQGSKSGLVQPREQLNEITSFIDGSQVYGSSEKVFNAIRDKKTEFLRTGPPIPANSKASLPIDTGKHVECMGGSGCFLAGDVRVNEQTGLIIMHTIWMREHNRVATALKAENPSWDSERIFQTARAIVGAEIQKITFKDYLPILLGDAMSLIGTYTGYKENVDPTIPNGFATAAFRYGHSQIKSTFDRLDNNHTPMSIGPLNLLDAFFDPTQFEKSGGTDPILRGLLDTEGRKVDQFVNNILTNHLFQVNSSSHGLDLASLNIQRGRDHGLPPYLTWRRWAEKECNLSGFFANNPVHLALLKTYGSLETVDLWVGGLAEKSVEGGLVGPTFACIFARTFEALRDGDRFYYENPSSALFTKEQRAEIEKTSLSRIICDNSDGITSIQPNAFLITQKRTSCSSIPKVDISSWVQSASSKCYVKALIQGRAVTIRTESDAGDSFSATYQPGDVCIPFTCPTDTKNRVIVSLTGSLPTTNPAEYSRCEVYPTSGLRVSQPTYNILAELGKLNKGGVYENLDHCRSTRDTNFSIFCSTYSVPTITIPNPGTVGGNPWAGGNPWSGNFGKFWKLLKELLNE